MNKSLNEPLPPELNELSEVDLLEVMSHPIRKLAGLIGLPELVKLLKARGGTLLKIPLSANKANVLHGIISHEAIERLCQEFGGQELLVPKLDKLRQQCRNQAIRQKRHHKSANLLAVEFNLSTRMIYFICNSGRG